MSLIKIPTSLNIELGFEAAPFYKRFFAWLIDVVLIVLYFIIVYKIYDLINPKFDENTANEAWLNMIIALPAVLYSFLCELTMNGQSFGKKITKIEIRSKHTYEMKFFLLIIRNISLLLWPVEAFMVLIFNNRIMDLLTRTIVVSSEYPADGSL